MTTGGILCKKLSGRGQLGIIKYFIDEQHVDPSCRDEDGNTPLHIAALHGKLEVVKYLITEICCNPMLKGQYGRTPLHHASQCGHLDVIKYLIGEQKVDPSCQDEDGNSSLHTAALGGQLEVVKYLIEEIGCDPVCQGQFGRTPLHFASQSGDLDVIKYFIDEQHVDPSCQDRNSDTPLHIAALSGQLVVVKYLITEKHCNPLCEDKDSRTLLHSACGSDNLDLIKYLIDEQQGNPSCRDKNGLMPIHCAAEAGSLSVVKYLITEKHCDPMCKDDLGRTPLHHASVRGLDVMKYLIDEQQVNPSCRDVNGETPLHYAAFAGQLEVVKYLVIEKHCNPRCESDSGDTPYDTAIRYGHLELVKFFTEEVDVSGVDDSPLGEQNLLDVLSATIEVAAKWKHIGDKFKLSPGTLETIRADYLHSEDSLREVILKWLQKSGYDHRQYGPPTWRWVVEAVNSPAGGNNPELARSIAAEHPRETVQEESLTFSSDEEYTFDRRKEQGFVLHVPKGAVSSSDCTVKVKSFVVTRSTPKYMFPKEATLASGVYHITTSRKLSKPVSLQIKHCAITKDDCQANQVEVVVAHSTNGPPYQFELYRGDNVRVFDSYIEVKLAHFSFISCILRAFNMHTSIRYCGLICCLKSSELTWEYHIVLIRNLQLCIADVKKRYDAAESVEELIVEFEEERDALTVSVEGTSTSEGWHVRPKWDPASVTKAQADEFTPGRGLPQCCVLASWRGEATSMGVLDQKLNFNGTQTLESYWVHRDAVPLVDRALRSSTPTPEVDVSGVDDSPLGEQNLLDVLSATIEVAAKWKHIGDKFKLSPGTLETIRADYLHSEDSLREVILKWLQKSGYDHRQYGPPTWRWVVEAVNSPAGGNNPELARSIAAEHPRDDIHVESDSDSFVTTVGLNGAAAEDGGSWGILENQLSTASTSENESGEQFSDETNTELTVAAIPPQRDPVYVRGVWWSLVPLALTGLGSVVLWYILRRQ